MTLKQASTFWKVSRIGMGAALLFLLDSPTWFFLYALVVFIQLADSHIKLVVLNHTITSQLLALIAVEVGVNQESIEKVLQDAEDLESEPFKK